MRIIRSIAIIYIIVTIFARFYSEKIMFVPHKSSYKDDENIIKIKLNSNEYISATFLRAKNSKYTILYSHGNGEDIGDLRNFLKLYLNKGYSVFVYDYPGYGTSSGKPTETGTIKSAEVAYSYLVEKLGVHPENLIILGRSIGGGPSLHLASKYTVAGLILENTFISSYRVITKYPLLLFDRFVNIAKINKINCPVLVVHGKMDKLIPFWHSEKLYEAARHPKYKLWLNKGTHNDMLYLKNNEYWEKINLLKMNSVIVD